MPKYLCWVPDFHPYASNDDGVEVDAFDAWSAAKEYAKRADNDSGSDISSGLMGSGDKLRVHVLGPDGVETLWDVWPEVEVIWYGNAAGVVEKRT